MSGAGAWLDEEGAEPIRTRPRGDRITAVASKSHLNQATIDYLEEAVGRCGYVAVGSSLKFCIVAEGKADIYPRASPTSEWDTAAGHAVLLAAGGLVDGPDGSRSATVSAPSSIARSSRRRAGSRHSLEPFLEPFCGRRRTAGRKSRLSVSAVSPGAQVALGDDVLVRLNSPGEATPVLVKEQVRKSATGIALKQFNPDLRFEVLATDIAAIEKVLAELVQCCLPLGLPAWHEMRNCAGG